MSSAPAADGAHQTSGYPLMSDAFAKDAILTWFRGEFAAANAIIDALCNHLTHVTSASHSSDYDSVFQAIHRRRLNWIPILHLQKYHSISDVALQLRRVTDARCRHHGGTATALEDVHGASGEAQETVLARGYGSVAEFEVSSGTGCPLLPLPEKMDRICSDHESCVARGLQMKLSRRFVAKESVKGHMVNVLKGMKLHEDIFTEQEISKLTGLVNELRDAGRNGQLSGETFVLFNEQMKGNRREMIHLGVPLFQQIREEETKPDNDISNCGCSSSSSIEPIPPLLKSVIDHLVSWQLVPPHKVPNSCVISFFDEEEYSQPFLKPPHLDQPVTTILLSQSTLAFGRSLTSENNGNFKGLVMLSLKQGSLLVMRGNSVDMARHAVCSSPTRRASITFFRVRGKAANQSEPPPLLTKAVKPDEVEDDIILTNGDISRPELHILAPPVVMLAARPPPLRPAVFGPGKTPNSGTGVFLPWRKPAKHLPPRAQKARVFAIPDGRNSIGAA